MTSLSVRIGSPLALLKQHSLLFGVLFLLSLVAGISQWLTGASVLQVLRDPLYKGPVSLDDPLTGCTSKGSPFDPDRDKNMKKPANVIDKFHKDVSEVIAEHEYHLKTPSLWKCDAKTFDGLMPPSPKLKAMAKKLPGLSAQDRKAGFSAFIPIIVEYQRVYECRLYELTEGRLSIVLEGQDTPSSLPSRSDFETASRTTSLTELLAQERRMTRTALEKTFNIFRSFELAAPMNIELNCLQREAVDVRNALSLLADTSSCLPKIWDAATSLHEPAQ